MANTTWSATDKSANITLSGSNLIAASTSSPAAGVRAADKQVAGKFYWELTWNTTSGANNLIGVTLSTTNLSASLTGGSSVGACVLDSAGGTWANGASVGVGLLPASNGQVVCVALNKDAGLVWFRQAAAGNWNGSGTANPASGVGGFSFYPGGGFAVYPMFQSFGAAGNQVTANFGDTAFTGAVPSGFTSGFTAGVTSSTNAIATQSALEHWIAANAPAQVTQVALEHWATVAAAIPSVDPIKVMVLA